jgi:hypothetical protein
MTGTRPSWWVRAAGATIATLIVAIAIGTLALLARLVWSGVL